MLARAGTPAQSSAACGLTRTPPESVRAILRAEVGKGCPFCGDMLLDYHHFDPPWSVRNHHEPQGMIALCVKHHRFADRGAFTNRQLHARKLTAANSFKRSGFPWMRRRMLAIVGGNFFFETPILLQWRNRPLICLDRDESGYLSLSLAWPVASDSVVPLLERNDWIDHEVIQDLQCSPTCIKAKLQSGDRLEVRFRPTETAHDLLARYKSAKPDDWDIPFPITSVEVTARSKFAGFALTPTKTVVGGFSGSGLLARGCDVGIAL